MRKYELTVLIRPDLESDIEAPISKVRDIVKKAGGEIKKEDNWGKKKLAYKIRKRRLCSLCLYGYYIASRRATKNTQYSKYHRRSIALFACFGRRKDSKIGR